MQVPNLGLLHGSHYDCKFVLGVEFLLFWFRKPVLKDWKCTCQYVGYLSYIVSGFIGRIFTDFLKIRLKHFFYTLDKFVVQQCLKYLPNILEEGQRPARVILEDFPIYLLCKIRLNHHVNRNPNCGFLAHMVFFTSTTVRFGW